MPGLTIYKASAGSGKTFAITREYIQLLFRDPDNFRRILGVTFTNKATAEMKGRILDELDKLARGAASDYGAEIQSKFTLNMQAMKLKASYILSRILHDYSHYAILTIDSFFQRIIRAFAREIGFYRGFEVELDQQKILTMAIDQMIFELDANPGLKDWLVRFAEDRILEGSNWNVIRDIEQIGQEVFKEKFNEVGSQLLEKMTNKEFQQNFAHTLLTIKSNFETTLRQKGKEAMDIIHTYNLTFDNFKGKSKSICMFFENLTIREKFTGWEISLTIRNHYNELNSWIGNNAGKNIDIEKAYHAGLNRILGEIIDFTKGAYSGYLSAVEIQKHLHMLGVVSDLLKYIREYTSQKNMMMITDTSRFLNKLIENSDAPFIYERTGTFVRHFMIDEFQDTSILQWQNFLPLIKNSLAEGHDNWVVGDVKQSIYRWRNSDWTILADQIYSDLIPFQVEEKSLNYNWRSNYSIVSFNNTFFNNIIHIVFNEFSTGSDNVEETEILDFENLLTKAYNQFNQLVPENKKKEDGLIRIEVLPSTPDLGTKFHDLALAKIPIILEQLQDLGYALQDIAILVRTRNEGSLVSEYLLKYQKQHSKPYRYDVISSDSLLLKNAEIVKWIIAAFTYITQPDDRLNKVFLAYEYGEYISQEFSKPLLGSYFNVVEPGFDSSLFDEFLNQPMLKQCSVYELSNKLIDHFRLTKLTGELPFIQAFQDMLQEYSQKEPVDVDTFLHWWDDNKDKRVISMPQNQDAVRLMTLHTAKGLEFKIVILPFADWSLMKTGYNTDLIWCSPDTAPFDSLELIPVNLSKGLQHTIFSKDYIREKALSYVDNLNLLYVAFTRATDGMFVMVPDNDREKVGNRMGNLISKALQINTFNTEKSNFPSVLLSEYWDEENMTFLFGKLPAQTDLKEQSVSQISMEAIPYITRDVSTVARQVIRADDYLLLNDERLASQINTGKVMHEVFQKIKTLKDVDNVLLGFELEGKISGTDGPKLKATFSRLLTSNMIQPWFSPEWEILTEASILLNDGSNHRPDRVLIKGNKAIVIEYKFGMVEQKSYIIQVKNYMTYLQQMNYTDIEGFIWYVNLDKVIPVLDSSNENYQ